MLDDYDDGGRGHKGDEGNMGFGHEYWLKSVVCECFTEMPWLDVIELSDP